MTTIRTMTELADFLEASDLPDAIIHSSKVIVPRAPSSIVFDAPLLAKAALELLKSGSVRTHGLDNQVIDGELEMDLEANGHFTSATGKARLRWTAYASSVDHNAITMRVRPVPATSDTVTRLMLLRADASDADLIRLNEIEKKAGFRTGTRFSLQGKTIYEVTVDMDTEEFFLSEGNGEPLPLTREAFDKTSSLCYWPR